MGPKAIRLRKQLLNPLKFKLFTLFKVPMARMAGLRMESLDEKECVTSVPFKFLNKNPFKSIYFAVQAMSAEFSTAALALLQIEEQEKSIAFIVVDLEAKFHKKAVDRVYFTCADGKNYQEALDRVVQTEGHSETVKAHAIGRMKDGTVVSEFWVTWSFKARS